MAKSAGKAITRSGHNETANMRAKTISGTVSNFGEAIHNALSLP